ncbi:XRE family transcriptional regulator [Uliginosibacterium sp. sgz301328]|uniref:XRE family transcriptional regulator n=1 Tax=Uliginosibacterium sp. sgz301328 TaxID=3243764 RepID=UPI00359D08E5
MSNLSERLIQTRNARGWSQEKLADEANVSQGTIGHLESGRNESSRKLAQIAQALGVDAAWLATGKGKPHHLSDSATEPASLEAEIVPIRRAELKLSAGAHGFGVEYMTGEGRPIYFRADWLRTHGYRPDRLLAMLVSGPSMEPTLYDGDIVVINLDDTRLEDGAAYAANYEGLAVIKRLKRDGGEWWLASDNTDKRRFPDKRCTEDVTIVGRAIYKQSSVV